MPGHTSGHGGKAGVGGQSPGPQGQKGGYGGGSGGGGFTGGGGGRRQPGLFGSLTASGTKKQIQDALKNPGIGRRLREELQGRLTILQGQEDIESRRLAKEAADAKKEFDRLAAERREREIQEAAVKAEIERNFKIQQEKEKTEREERQARLQKEQEEEAAARKAKADAEAAAKAAKEREADALRKQQLDYLSNPAVQDALKDLPSRQPGLFGTLTPQDVKQRTTINTLIDKNPNVFKQFANEEGFIDPSQFIIEDDILKTSGTKQRIGSVGQFGDMLPGPMSAIGSFFMDPSTPTFTVDPIFAREGQRGGQGGGLDSIVRQMGGPDRESTDIPSVLPQQKQEEQKQEEEQEILSGFTGAERGSSPQFISSLPVSGIAAAPNVANYMDYLKSAFTPVNLASPFGGAFSNNPVYRAAHGGFIGFMDEPLNIMYPSNGNTVVHDGISSILKKYKEIRSEL